MTRYPVSPYPTPPLSEIYPCLCDFESDYFGEPTAMDIRVIDQNGEPWFVARDVVSILGYANLTEAVRRYCKYTESAKGERFAPLALGLHPQTKLIPESDLYRLIMRSDMPEATRFQDWVCEEVLCRSNRQRSKSNPFRGSTS